MDGRQSFRVARGLRRAQTPQEKRLWQALRGRQLAGLKFYRQHPVFDYIADFYCPERRLVVELDGDVHEESEQAEYDTFRNAAMRERGLTVLRVPNDEVDTDLTGVLRQIRDPALALPQIRNRERRVRD